MYKMDGRIRYSEVGHDGRLSLVGLVNYFQDCSTCHSNDVGLGPEYLVGINRAWILSGWQIVIERLPQLDERIEVFTWPYDFRGFIGMRNYQMLDAEKRRIAVANSIWTLIDLEKRTPVRITQQEIDGYEVEGQAEMEYAPRKIKLEGEAKEQPSLTVARERIDTNGHMNNGQYVSLAAEYLPEDISVRQIRVEYKREVRCGDVLMPMLYPSDGMLAVELKNEGQVCAVVEFTW